MPVPASARESCGDTEWGVQGGAGQQAHAQQSSKLPRQQHAAVAPDDVGVLDLFEGLPTVADEQQVTVTNGTAAPRLTRQHPPPTTLDVLGTGNTSSAKPHAAAEPSEPTADDPQEARLHLRAVTAWVEPASAPGQTIIPAAPQALPEANAAPWPNHISAPAPQEAAAQDNRDARRRAARLVRDWLPIQVTSSCPVPRPKVNNHTLLRPLCHGGFATVYEAEDDETGEVCAFKLSTQPLLVLGKDQGAEVLDSDTFLKELHNTNWHYRCFVKEVTTYQELRCDLPISTTLGLPHLLESGLTLLPGKAVHAFLAMTLLGQSVYSEICAGRTREPGSFQRIAHAMLGALEHMHTHSYVHRDIKPGNFCLTTPALTGSPAAFILDFGFAKRYTRDPACWKENEAFEGTPDYASIHSLRGKRQGPRDDLESLAYAFLEMLQGTLPWDVTEPQTWPPEFRERLELRIHKQAGGDGAAAAQPVCAADMEWTDLNLAIMADLRVGYNQDHAATGFIPKPLVQWLHYVQGLQPWELPVYDYLHRLIEECATWQLSRWASVSSQLAAQGLGVPSLTLEAAGGMGHAVAAPLSGCLSGGSYGMGPSDAESWYTAGSKRPRGSSCGYRTAEQGDEECDEVDQNEEDEDPDLPEPGHLIWSEEQPGPSKRACVDVKGSQQLYPKEE